MAGYSRDDLVDRLCADGERDLDGNGTGGYGLDELDAEAAVDKFYAIVRFGGGLSAAEASDPDLAVRHIVGTDAYWEK